MQIVNIAALRALLEGWRREHGEATGCWINADAMKALTYRIAEIVQQPAPGEKVYQTIARDTDA